VLFSEPKIPQCEELERRINEERVSVLFSEPKIPQSSLRSTRLPLPESFSALQRAENSSIALRPPRARAVAVFQCSSASRKFLNSAEQTETPPSLAVSVLFSEPKIPQFTSATSVRSR